MAADLSSAASAQQHSGDRRALQAARCALCGIELPLGLLVPDGGHACADLRWYCKDAPRGARASALALIAALVR